MELLSSGNEEMNQTDGLETSFPSFISQMWPTRESGQRQRHRENMEGTHELKYRCECLGLGSLPSSSQNESQWQEGDLCRAEKAFQSRKLHKAMKIPKPGTTPQEGPLSFIPSRQRDGNTGCSVCWHQIPIWSVNLPGLSLKTCSSWTLRDHPLSAWEVGLWKRDGWFSSQTGALCRPGGGWLL